MLLRCELLASYDHGGTGSSLLSQPPTITAPSCSRRKTRLVWTRQEAEYAAGEESS
jgi:hypothetical protein